MKESREMMVGTVDQGIEEVRNASGQGYAKRLVIMKVTGPPQSHTLDVCNYTDGTCIRELVRAD